MLDNTFVNITNEHHYQNIRIRKAETYHKMYEFKKTLKINAIAIMIIAPLITLITGCSAYHDKVGIFERKSSTYSDCGVVVEVSDNSMTIMNMNGNMWDIELPNGNEDWYELDLVSYIAEDNGTDIVYDDEITYYQYSGYITQDEFKKEW